MQRCFAAAALSTAKNKLPLIQKKAYLQPDILYSSSAQFISVWLTTSNVHEAHTCNVSSTQDTVSICRSLLPSVLQYRRQKQLK